MTDGTNYARITCDQSGGDNLRGYCGAANARLIAAAPDLLNALQRLTHPAADDTDLEHALDVIARATGEARGLCEESPMYMNPFTGSVDTLDGWESAEGLVQVRLVDGTWVEV